MNAVWTGPGARGDATDRGMDDVVASQAETPADEAGGGEPRESADLRWRLRAATDAAHRRLDAGFAAHDLTRRVDYGAFLTAMYRAFAPLETWLDGVDPEDLPPDWAERRRAEALRADLSGLGLAIPEGPGAVALPRDGAPGLLYVLEGSRLGGQVLLRQVLASPDPMVRGNARFLRHGEGLRLWPGFVAWLAARPMSESEAAIQGALAAFAAFEAVA